MKTAILVTSLALICGCAAQESFSERQARIDALYAAQQRGEPGAALQWLLAAGGTGAQPAWDPNYNPQLSQINRSLQGIEDQLRVSSYGP